MRALFREQGGCCAYTGLPLVLGDTSSVDHRTPISRGGLHVIENLQWVSRAVNIMKADMTHEEFLDTCRAIVSFRGRRGGCPA